MSAPEDALLVRKRPAVRGINLRWAGITLMSAGNPAVLFLWVRIGRRRELGFAERSGVAASTAPEGGDG